MPKKKRTVAAQAAEMGPLPEMPAELIEQLVTGPMSASEVQTLFLSFKKAVIERAMSAEMKALRQVTQQLMAAMPSTAAVGMTEP